MNYLEASYNAHAAAPVVAMVLALLTFVLFTSYGMATDHGRASRGHLASAILVLLLFVAQWPIYVFTLESPPTCQHWKAVCK